MNVGGSYYKVFFAFPFDATTTPMYKGILKTLKKRFPHFEFIFGNSSFIKPTPKFLKIHLFKKQNNDLLKQFITNIRSSDIIVADLTYNNPNVHVELGIAISLNKNILRVSSRNLSEVGSDVRGYEVNNYSYEKALRKRLEDYLNQFLDIKELPLSRKSGPLYSVHFLKAEPIEHERIREIPKGGLPPGAGLPFKRVPGFSMRDGALRAQFQFRSAEKGEDWFGVYFRYGSENPWAGGGYLLYLRKNGMLELAELPNVRILRRKKYPALDLNRNHTLQFKVDGSNLVAWLDRKVRKCLETKKLNIQSPGRVAFGCHGSKVTFSHAETVCRDTINFY
jgi:hypothetical protein